MANKKEKIPAPGCISSFMAGSMARKSEVYATYQGAPIIPSSVETSFHHPISQHFAQRYAIILVSVVISSTSLGSQPKGGHKAGNRGPGDILLQYLDAKRLELPQSACPWDVIAVNHIPNNNSFLEVRERRPLSRFFLLLKYRLTLLNFFLPPPQRSLINKVSR